MKVFEEVDEEKAGFIDAAELVVLVGRMGRTISEEEAEVMIATVDGQADDDPDDGKDEEATPAYFLTRVSQFTRNPDIDRRTGSDANSHPNLEGGWLPRV